MRFKVGAPTLINTPTTSRNAQTPDDSLPLAIDGLIAHGVAPSQLSLNLAGCTVVAGVASCNPAKGIFPNSSAITENIPVALDNIGSSNNVIGKIDYHLNDRNSINGEYFFGNANTDTPTTGAAPWWINGNHSRTQMSRVRQNPFVIRQREPWLPRRCSSAARPNRSATRLPARLRVRARNG